MTPDTAFQIANLIMLAGWLTLAAGVLLRRDSLRDLVAGRLLPLTLCAIYAVLIFAFWNTAEGGFDTLANLRKLFETPWVVVAGWVHYLAFDLFVGSHIARRVMREGLPRYLLIGLLPLTLLFGPIGYLAFAVVRLAFRAKTFPVPQN